MIVDPNRPENNISGGTDRIDTICVSFSEAHQILQAKLAVFEKDPMSVTSFLEAILGSDFSAYEAQRDILYELYYGSKRTNEAPTGGA